MDIFLQCLGRHPKITGTMRLPDDDTAQATNQFVDTIFNSEKDGVELRLALNEIIRTNGWKQNFARAVFEALQKAIETTHPMGDALREIYDKVVLVDGIQEFVSIFRAYRSCPDGTSSTTDYLYPPR